MNRDFVMVELNIEQLEEINGGVLPLLAAHFLFNASTAASVYTVAKYFGK